MMNEVSGSSQYGQVVIIELVFESGDLKLMVIVKAVVSDIGAIDDSRNFAVLQNFRPFSLESRTLIQT